MSNHVKKLHVLGNPEFLIGQETYTTIRDKSTVAFSLRILVVHGGFWKEHVHAVHNQRLLHGRSTECQSFSTLLKRKT